MSPKTMPPEIQKKNIEFVEGMKKRKRNGCPFARGWKNKEGWLVVDAPEPYNLVCLDWDDYCTLCRKDDKEDYVFGLRGD